MTNRADNEESANRFSAVAREFCAVVESLDNLDRNTFIIELYGVMPRLIAEVVRLPDVDLDDDEKGGNDNEPAGQIKNRPSHKHWQQFYDRLKKSLGDWDLYWQVFDPTKDSEAIRGSLADDIADIYRDLKGGLGLMNSDRLEKAIFDWRVLFLSHWGKHAIDALGTIHTILGPYLD